MGKLQISSTAFEHQGAVPKKYTCQGDDISPPLAWSGLPDGTKSVALIVDVQGLRVQQTVNRSAA